MHKNRQKCNRRKRAALKVLKSPRFFSNFLLALKRDGLVGEERNALVLLIVMVSRLLRHPLHVFVKARSSAGKNFLVKRVLRFMPRHAVTEVTSASEKAWNYLNKDFRHTVIYLQEENEAAGNIQPLRLLISEGKLIRLVPMWEGNKRVTKRYLAQGPVSSISTTTKQRLTIDDENRHVSIRMDESKEQTARIVKSYARPLEGLTREERRTWRMVQRILKKSIGADIIFPEWFEKVADYIASHNDLRLRRYHPAFVEACRTVCLIRSFQKDRHMKCLEVDFADFAITALIFDQVFVECLNPHKSAHELTRQEVERLYETKGRPAGVKDLAKALKISKDQASRKLRTAEAAGTIARANKPEKGNRKLYVARSAPRFAPDPEKLFHELQTIKAPVTFAHPITGKTVEYSREK